MPLSLLWLSLGAFAIGTEGFMIAGLLTRIAADLQVSVALAGQVVTFFALAYAFGAPLMAVATGGLERKRLLLSALAAFALANLFAALAVNFTMLAIARVLLALAAGTFMPAASGYAATLVAPERRGRAIALVYSGLTIAIVAGVPLGTMVGALAGWRFTFIGVAGLAALALIGIALFIAPHPGAPTASMAERFAIARSPGVPRVLALTFFTMMGGFTLYTYLTPYLQEVAHFGSEGVAAMLFLFGVGSAIGNLSGGYAADRWNARRFLLLALLALASILALFALMAEAAPVSLAARLAGPATLLWGLVGWSIGAAQQTRLVRLQPGHAPIVLSLNSSALYLGASGGAVLGSFALTLAAPGLLGWIGCACQLFALVALIGTVRTVRAPLPAAAGSD